MKGKRNISKVIVITFVLGILLTSLNLASVHATSPFQTGSPASSGAGPKGSGVAGVTISTQDKLLPRAPVPDPRPFQVGSAVSESQLAQQKSAARKTSPAAGRPRSPQSDQSIPQSKALPQAPIPLPNNWPGIGYTGYNPPDPTIAVGTDHVVVAVNASWAIYDKSGNLLYSTTLDSWFANVVPSGTFIYSPKVLYDQHSSRWVLTALGFKSSTSQSWWLISVSLQASALGYWKNYPADATLNGGTATTNFADSPGLGVDDQALYLTANMFRFSDSTFQYAKLRILNKSVLYAAGTLSWWDFWNLQNPDSSQAFSVIPSHTFGSPGVEYLVNSFSGSGSSLTMWALTNPLGTPSLAHASLSVYSYSLPPDAEQPYTTDLIGTGDARLFNAVYRQGSVWTTHSVAYDWGSGTRAMLEWYQINPVTVSLQNEGGFGASSLYYYYPTIMADVNGNAALVFNRSGTTEYASIRYTGRMPTDTGLQSSAQLKAGEATFSSFYWGYYSGIALDSNGTWFWMFHEYAASGGNWSTWVGAATFGTKTYLPIIGKSAQVAPPTSTPKPYATLYINNKSGQNMSFEVVGTGIGSQTMPPGTSVYGTFPLGTYSWTAALFCGPLSGSDFIPGGDTTWPFGCYE